MNKYKKLKIGLFTGFLILSAFFAHDTRSAVNIYPYLMAVDTTSITIMWRTSVAGTSQVDYGLTDSYGTASSSSASVNMHEIVLTGLTENTTYHYKTTTGGDESADYTFKTAPSSGSFTFMIYGDSRSRPAQHTDVITSTLNHNPATFFINVGDMVDLSDDYADWETELFTPLQSYVQNNVLFPTKGNHDVTGTAFEDYLAVPSGGTDSYYSFDYGDAHFTIIDNNISTAVGSAQHTWISNDLASTNKKWKIVAMHSEVYVSRSSSWSDTSKANLEPLFKQYDVDMVFSGHFHAYERSWKDDVLYFVTGGGGAYLYAVNQTPNEYQQYAESTLQFMIITLNSDGTAILNSYNDSDVLIDTLTLPVVVKIEGIKLEGIKMK